MASTKAPENYNPQLTEECKQALALLLSGLGDWAKCVVLIGGLTPELLKAKAVKPQEYVGTEDVDLVVSLEILTNMEAYSTIEHVLLQKGFKPLGKAGKAWQWEFTAASGKGIQVDFLSDDGSNDGGKVFSIPDHGQLAVCNIPHSNIVFDHLETATFEVELPNGGGFIKVEVRYADIVGFTVLKILAFRNRTLDKDAHDLIYSLENCGESIPEIADRFATALTGRHADVIGKALGLLEDSFANEERRAGYEKHGPAAVAIFERVIGRDERILRQRQVADVVMELLSEIERRNPPPDAAAGKT
jgi:predicted nucleotidyltransferase